jgi:spermidine synthase
MWILIILIGTLIGLELPLLTRIFREYTTLRIALANALTFDYLGGLIGALAFPLLLLPLLGIFETSLVMGLANLAVVIGNLILFRREIQHFKQTVVVAVLVTLGLVGVMVISDPVSGYLEQRLYTDRIILSKASKYQRIVVTRWKDDVRLYINGHLQFSAMDEYRYHEALIHPAASLIPSRAQVLVLGGGDGLAAREILKYGDVAEITVVDLDPMITELASTDSTLRRLNQDALHNPKVKVINQDAQQFLQATDQRYNLIIIDLPDPTDASLGSLYSDTFYHLVKRHLAKDGLAVTQSSSPFFCTECVLVHPSND